MRLATTLLILLGGVAISVAVWLATGGRFVFVFLPLILAWPLLWRGRGPRP